MPTSSRPITVITNPVMDALYAAFADESRPQTIEGCECCVDAEEVVKLLSIPLRQVSPLELGSYASSVFLTVGSEADFRYFLPRILEVLATELRWWPDPEVVGKAMRSIPWSEYTNGQRQALSDYFDAVFAALFTASAPEGCEIDSWLCCSSFVLPEWSIILNRLLTCPKSLVALYTWHAEPLQKRRLGNGFWSDSPRREQFLNWMLSEPVRFVLRSEWGL